MYSDPMVRRHGMFILASALFGAAIVAMTVALLVQGARHDQILLRYRASQSLTAMIDRSVRTNDLRETGDLPPYVLGFGVFDAAGVSLFSVGSVGTDALSDTELTPLVHGRDPKVDTGRTRSVARSGSEVTYHTDEVLRVVRRSGLGIGGGLVSGEIESISTGRSRGRIDGQRIDGQQVNGSALFWVLDYASDSIIQERRVRILFVSFLVGSVITLAAVALLLRRSIRRVEERARRNESLAQLGAAARTISHEIKNPLASIRLQTSLLRRIVSQDQKVQTVLETMDEEVGRIAALTDEVRSFLRDPKGTPSVIDVAAAIRELIPRQPFAIELIESDDVAYIHFDRLRFHSIITNLVLNAHQAMDEGVLATVPSEGKTPHGGTPPVSVTIETAPAAGRAARGSVAITVTDTGPGIPPAIRSSVFDPFFTTRSEGTGIGLATVYTFVTAAGGTIEIGDAPSGGASVIVRFPRAEERPE
jgi:signal transduction histidine kinase